MRKPSLSKISALLFIFILLLRGTSSLADTYFDIVADDGFYGEKVFDG